jgi:putative ABC transport system permease protein
MSALPSRRAGRAGWHLPVSMLDVRLGARMLLKHPLMTVVSVISLAVGIPVGLAPMHVFDALEAPLPVQDGDRVLGLRYWSRQDLRAVPATEYDFSAWKGALTSFRELGAARIAEYNLDSGGGAGGAVSGAEVTASAFSVLHAAPLLGRTLGPADEAAGGPPVVVLGYDLWQSRFGGDRGVVSRTVRIGDVVHTVVGVMPRGFRFPVREQMWLPLRARPAGEPGRGAPLHVFGRLADGATLRGAEAQLGVVRQRMSSDFPAVYEFLTAEAVPFAIAVQGSPRGGWRSMPGTWVISAGAMVLLMVACANVGLLIFARTAARSAELSMRAALGADRARIVAQVFIEVLVLAVVSTVVGLLLIQLLSSRLLAGLWSSPLGGLPWWVDLGVTPGMVARALLLAVLSAALASVLPTLRVTGRRMQESIRRAGATGAGVRLGPVSSALIVVDMAMAVAVVGLVIGISQRMESIAVGQAGFPADQFLSAEITVTDASLSPEEDTLAAAARVARVAPIQRALVERLQAEGGVRGVAVADVLPRMDHGFGLAEVQGGTPGDRYGAHEVDVAHVDPGFFAGLGQPIVSGRGFNAGDLRGDRTAVLVNRTFARRTLGGRSPVGRRLRYLSPADGKPGPWYEIVGVVPDLGTSLMEPQHGGLGVYHPAAAGEIYPLRVAIHLGTTTPTTFTPRLRELASRVDASVIVARPEALDRVFPEGWSLLNGLRIGWSVFAGVLLVLAVSGMYTMTALSVAQRTREIGIRTALGARSGHIVAAIGRRAALQLGAGALIGMPLAGWIYHQIQAQYDASAPSAVAVALVPGVIAMLLIGGLACTVPLLRALRIMPTVAMRNEA